MGEGLKGFTKLTPIVEAWREFKSEIKLKSGVEEVPLFNALGRVLAEDIIAPIDLPPFNTSALDGYAVRAEETFNASRYNPALIDVKHVVKVSTGDALPNGYDAVVPLELTEAKEGFLEIYSSVPKWGNVNRKGFDVSKGSRILNKGRKLRPWDLALLTSLGFKYVKVFRVLRAIIYPIGSELRTPPFLPTERLRPESNSLAIKALLEFKGMKAKVGEILKDEVREISGKLVRASEEADIIITLGGTSIGGRDVTVRAVENVGEVIAHGIAMRPGKPTALAKIEGKPVICLSGYPVAAFIAFKTFVEPLVDYIMRSYPQLKVIYGKLSSRVPSEPGLVDFVRAKLRWKGDTYIIVPIRRSGSSLYSSLTRSEGTIVIPEGVEGLEENALAPFIFHEDPWYPYLGLT